MFRRDLQRPHVRAASVHASGRSTNNAMGVTYPGKIGGHEWNKEQIRRALAPAMRYQNDYHVPIYIGEFSAIRWAPGAAAYLRDLIEVMEENQWDWAYHAFREWDGWVRRTDSTAIIIRSRPPHRPPATAAVVL